MMTNVGELGLYGKLEEVHKAFRDSVEGAQYVDMPYDQTKREQLEGVAREFIDHVVGESYRVAVHRRTVMGERFLEGRKLRIARTCLEEARIYMREGEEKGYTFPKDMCDRVSLLENELQIYTEYGSL